MNKEKLKVILPDSLKMRADKYISYKGLLSRSQMKNRNMRIFLNNSEIRLSQKISHNDILEVEWEELSPRVVEAEKLPLHFIYEDENVIVLNKEQGMVVHPGNGNYTGTLVQGLLYHSEDLRSNFQDELERPGIVHRLDKDTSGLIITAKNAWAYEALFHQFRTRINEKFYLAVVRGYPPKRRGLIDNFITRHPGDRKKFITHESEGKNAITEYRVMRNWGKYALVLLKLVTGRTHQLRVHMAHISCPIVGDPIYGRKDNKYPEATLMLHAWKLGIRLPGHDDMNTFQAPIPPRFKKLLGEISDKMSYPPEQ